MKQLFIIALLAITASGCAVSNSKLVKSTPSIGMSEEDFRLAYPKADLVYLTSDSSAYKIYRGRDLYVSTDDFFYFKKKSLIKFEQKDHFFEQSTLRIEESKQKKN